MCTTGAGTGRDLALDAAIRRRAQLEQVSESTAKAPRKRTRPALFAAKQLRVGSWVHKSVYAGDVIVRFYFAKREIILCWLSNGMGTRIVIPFRDVKELTSGQESGMDSHLKLLYVNRPLLQHEIDPVPGQASVWSECPDTFSGGHLASSTCALVICRTDELRRPLLKLFEMDARLKTVHTHRPLISSPQELPAAFKLQPTAQPHAHGSPGQHSSSSASSSASASPAHARTSPAEPIDHQRMNSMDWLQNNPFPAAEVVRGGMGIQRLQSVTNVNSASSRVPAGAALGPGLRHAPFSPSATSHHQQIHLDRNHISASHITGRTNHEQSDLNSIDAKVKYSPQFTFGATVQPGVLQPAASSIVHDLSSRTDASPMHYTTGHAGLASRLSDSSWGDNPLGLQTHDQRLQMLSMLRAMDAPTSVSYSASRETPGLDVHHSNHASSTVSDDALTMDASLSLIHI